jgi:hypothetical protein
MNIYLMVIFRLCAQFVLYCVKSISSIINQALGDSAMIPCQLSSVLFMPE